MPFRTPKKATLRKKAAWLRDLAEKLSARGRDARWDLAHRIVARTEYTEEEWAAMQIGLRLYADVLTSDAEAS